MFLELTNEEAQELRRALDVYMEEMDFEVARTARRDFRHELVADRETLGAVRRRIEALMPPERTGVGHH